MFATWKLAHFQDGWSRLTDFWCFLMHRRAMWPMKGYYQCSRCKRMFRVPWENY